MSWSVYIAKCKDQSFYIGITQDVKRRIVKHNLGKGARYTRGRRPVVLVFQRVCRNHAEAARAEIFMKRWSRKHKELLVSRGWPFYKKQQLMVKRKIYNNREK